MKSKTRAKGFSLIELIIAVAIVGILAAIAYPSYQEQVRKGKRTDATGALLDVAQRLERCYTQFNAYNAAGCVTFPVTSPEREYSITAPTLTATTFTLQAAPAAGSSQTSDTNCKNFTYTHTGVKNVTDSSKDRDYCW